MDPDLIKKHAYIGQAADVWALGVILFALLTSMFPFASEFEADLSRKIIKAKYNFPSNLQPSQAVKSLLEKILEPDASKRITAE